MRSLFIVNDVIPQVVDEFDLGDPISADSLAGGGPEVVKLVTTTGSYVVKPVYRNFEMDLYADVEVALNSHGVRQARLFRTRHGATVSASGHSVQEWLAGTITMTPSRAQADALFGHLAAFDRALAGIAVPPALDATDTVFTRVVQPDYLRSRLPELLQRFAPAYCDPAPVETGLSLLRDPTGGPRQLVHGDIGPDNVLYDGDAVVAIIDFTPFHQPVYFGLATAVYWFHVIGTPSLDGIRSALKAYGTTSGVPMLLLLEALRRVATPLAVAEETGRSASPEAVRRRYAALHWITQHLDELGS